jgi:8-hydroxy-5-deazaflavin:NADPH oxidoreductase
VIPRQFQSSRPGLHAHAAPRTTVGVLGGSALGLALATGFARQGHAVMVGTNDQSSGPVLAWHARHGARGHVGSFEQAAAFGGIIVVATQWRETPAALRAAGLTSFTDKIVIDATNPIPVTDAGARPERPGGESHGEWLQRRVPGARVVKAFNAIGPELVLAPDLPGGPPDMFLCGNDDDAKRTVAQICEAFGWIPVDLGGVDVAPLLESLGSLWWLLRVQDRSGLHAFKVLRMPAAEPVHA